MPRKQYCLLLASIFVVSVIVRGQNADRGLYNESDWRVIQGESTNGLQPSVVIGRQGGVWSLEIAYMSQSNFPTDAWLQITNRFGSRIRLFLPDGSEVTTTNRNLLDANALPKETSVSNVFRNVPRQMHSRQWLPLWPDHKGTTLGKSVPAAVFSLDDAFLLPSSKPLLLEITPLLYRVDQNRVNAILVEFPTIKMKLLTNGAVQKVGDSFDRKLTK